MSNKKIVQSDISSFFGSKNVADDNSDNISKKNHILFDFGIEQMDANETGLKLLFDFKLDFHFADNSNQIDDDGPSTSKRFKVHIEGSAHRSDKSDRNYNVDCNVSVNESGKQKTKMYYQ